LKGVCIVREGGSSSATLCKKWRWCAVEIFKSNLLDNGSDVEEDNKTDYEDEE
jgi:hypothetical protein